MSYQIQAGAPQVTVGSNVYALGAFIDSTPIGAIFMVAVMQKVFDGWNEISAMIADYPLGGSLVADVEKAGGVDAFCSNVIMPGITKQLATVIVNSPAPPVAPRGTPMTEADIIAAISAFVNKKSLALTNGALVAA